MWRHVITVSFWWVFFFKLLRTQVDLLTPPLNFSCSVDAADSSPSFHQVDLFWSLKAGDSLTPSHPPLTNISPSSSPTTLHELFTGSTGSSLPTCHSMFYSHFSLTYLPSLPLPHRLGLKGIRVRSSYLPDPLTPRWKATPVFNRLEVNVCL